jgi:hypothetical protein
MGVENFAKITKGVLYNGPRGECGVKKSLFCFVLFYFLHTHTPKKNHESSLQEQLNKKLALKRDALKGRY